MAATTQQAEKSTNSKGGEAGGRVVRTTGPVVDVEFPRGSVPELFNALHADISYKDLAKTLTLEVAQHLGDNLVRTISMQPTDGLVRGVEVTDTGKGICRSATVSRATCSMPWVSALTSRVTGKTSTTGRFTVSRRRSTSSSRAPRCSRPG